MRNKEKVITIWTNKGGNAKTSIAVALSKEFDFPVITNDTASPIGNILGEDWAIVLGLNEDIPSDFLKGEQKLIFDLGGKAEDRVVIAAQHSDVVIMPIIHNSHLDMDVFKLSIDAMLEINPNIVLVVAATKNGSFKLTEEELNHFYPNLPVIELKETTAFARICDPDLDLESSEKDAEGNPIPSRNSISDICKSQPFLAHHYSKVIKQLHSLLHAAFESSENKAA